MVDSKKYLDQFDPQRSGPPLVRARTSRGFYEDLPAGKITYYKHTTQALWTPGAGTYPIPDAAIAVGSDRVFDLTYVAWRFLIGTPDPSVRVATHDDYTSQDVRYDLDFNRKNPLDRRTVTFGALTEVGALSGTARLNGNIYDADDGTKFHIIFRETGTLNFSYTVITGGLLAPPGVPLVEVEVRGIWIPKVLWSNIEEELR